MPFDVISTLEKKAIRVAGNGFDRSLFGWGQEILRDAENSVRTGGNDLHAGSRAMELVCSLPGFDHNHNFDHLVDGCDCQGEDHQQIDFASSFQAFQIPFCVCLQAHSFGP